MVILLLERPGNEYDCGRNILNSVRSTSTCELLWNAYERFTRALDKQKSQILEFRTLR